MPDEGDGRVLLVDDDETIGLTVSSFLEGSGFAVDWVASGEAALEAVGRRRYGLILMDCRMPGLSGLDATRKIRTGETTRRVPIVGLSGLAGHEEQQASREAGMDGLIEKPCSPATLIDTVETWLGRPVEAPTREDPATPVRSEILDRETIELLASLPSPDGGTVLTEVIDRFFAERQPLATIREAAAIGDWPQVRELAHTLKGTAGAIGATRLVALCDDLQRSAGRSEAEASRRRLEIVSEEHARVEAELARIRSEGS